jgi:hypothetical protein
MRTFGWFVHFEVELILVRMIGMRLIALGIAQGSSPRWRGNQRSL